MFGKRFKKELELVENAISNEEGKEKLKIYLIPTMESAVEEYSSYTKNKNVTKKQLELAGWKYLQLALNKYKNRSELMQKGQNDIYYFSTYFAWYARQGIIEYLNSVENRQNN